MKKGLFIFIGVAFLFLQGCSSIKGIFGKNSSKQATQLTKIEKIEDKQAANNQNKLEQVGVLSFGIDYSLNKLTNKEPPVEVALDINERLKSIAPSPPIEQMKEMIKIVNTLLTDKVEGLKLLNKKDREIDDLQQKSKQLQNEWGKEIDKYKLIASNTALRADALQGELNDYRGWLGLKAVWKGLWQFIRSSVWILSIGGVIFIILRFASLSNPIAASVFSLFSRVGAWIIHIIEFMVPKALDKAGQVSKIIYNETCDLLNKIVDSVEWIKEIEKQTGQPVTLKQLFDQLDKTMDVKEKKAIEDIKRKLGYN